MTHCEGKPKILNKSQAESLCCDHLYTQYKYIFRKNSMVVSYVEENCSNSRRTKHRLPKLNDDNREIRNAS